MTEKKVVVIKIVKIVLVVMLIIETKINVVVIRIRIGSYDKKNNRNKSSSRPLRTAGHRPRRSTCNRQGLPLAIFLQFLQKLGGGGVGLPQE